jgi:DNA modification methylase
VTVYDDGVVRMLIGDCRDVLATLPAERVQCVVTSPPYWGLRDYGAAGQIGLEPTPEEYVAHVVEVFRAVRRVLREDGTVWLNLGDSYASDIKGSGGRSHSLKFCGTAERGRSANGIVAAQRFEPRTFEHGLKPKDLVGIPWRVAFALQADGWYLRADIIWAKPNPMPESVTDRPTKAHEYVFLLAKSERYFFDQEAVRQAWADDRCGAPGGRRPAERN